MEPTDLVSARRRLHEYVNRLGGGFSVDLNHAVHIFDGKFTSATARRWREPFSEPGQRSGQFLLEFLVLRVLVNLLVHPIEEFHDVMEFLADAIVGGRQGALLVTHGSVF